MTKDEFLKILASHRQWVDSEGKEGKKADLRGADLHGLELSGDDLSGVNLRGANLQGVNFGEANLQGVNLQEAELQEANLAEAKGLLARQLAGANVSGAELPQDIASFDGLKYVDAASSHAQKLFFSLLLVCVYCWLTIATTTDAGLLTNFAESSLPIINTKISIVWFYWAAPLLLLCFYLYFQIYLQRLWEGLAELPAVFPDGRPLPHRIHPWLLNGFPWAFFTRLKNERPPLSRLQNFLAIILAWWLVPATLFAFWLRYLSAHEWITTSFHIGLLTLAMGGNIGFSFLTAATLRLKEKRPFFWKKSLIDRRAYKGLALFFITVVLGVGFSFFSIVAIEGVPSTVLSYIFSEEVPSSLPLFFTANLRDAEVSLKPP
jgi:hypothetical protein